METMQCPNCGSNDVRLVAFPEYQCLHCGTRIILPQAPSGFVDVVVLEVPGGINDIDRIKKLCLAAEIDLSLAKNVLHNTPWVIHQNIPADLGKQIISEIEKVGGKAVLKQA